MQSDGPVAVLKHGADTRDLDIDFQGKIVVGKVDTDNNREISMKFGISAIPTVILFSGGQVARKFVGLQGKKDLKAAIDSLLE